MLHNTNRTLHAICPAIRLTCVWLRTTDSQAPLTCVWQRALSPKSASPPPNAVSTSEGPRYPPHSPYRPHLQPRTFLPSFRPFSDP
jgi:hypothetical protein